MSRLNITVMMTEEEMVEEISEMARDLYDKKAYTDASLLRMFRDRYISLKERLTDGKEPDDEIEG